MLRAFRIFVMGFVCLAVSERATGQSNFTWANKTIGGGGFGMEIRFDPYNIYRPAGSPPTLYLATDVSGLYRSTNLGVSWQPVWSSNQLMENNAIDRFAKSIAFNGNAGVVLIGTQEGIYCWTESTQEWGLVSDMPDRNDLQGLGLNMVDALGDPDDGLYPEIGIIRECPSNTSYFLAGIGDVRYKVSHGKTVGATDITPNGLSALLRSVNGGSVWQVLKLPDDSPDETVYDIDYVTDASGDIHTFVSTGWTKRTSAAAAEDDTYEYGGGIYYSGNVFASNTLSNPSLVSWKKISADGATYGGQSYPLTNVVSLVLLTTSSVNPPPLDDNILAFASRCIQDNVPEIISPKGGMFRTVFKLEKFSDPSNPNYQPQWRIRHKEERTGRLGVKPKSTRTNFELYLGKNQGEGISLCVTQPADIPPEGTNDPVAFQNILDNSPGNEDNDDGYRGKIILPNGNIVTELKFGSFDFNPEDLRPHPAVFGCWGGGPVMTEGHSDPDYRKIRTYQQIFTDKINGTYRSRGMDELFFDSGTPVFHPNNSNIIMIGCTDNPILRSENGGESWSHIRLRNPGDWFGGKQHHVYHIAFHPQNANTVLVSGGSANHHPQNPGRGALFANVNGGVGDGITNWQMIGGNTDDSQPNNESMWTNGLPIAEMQSFVFDVKEDRRGVFVAARNHGLYYGRINSDGTIDAGFNGGKFAKIIDPELDAIIPYATTGGHHYYSRIMFDPANQDHLYVARHYPSGGVFRLILKSDRTSLNPADCVEQVDEVIKGRFNGATAETDVDTSKTAEVINLLVTPTHVFAGVTCGHQADDANGKNYSGGLIRWAKNAIPTDYHWKIGGPTAIGPSSKTIAIGGLAQDPLDANTILTVTYRFRLRADRHTSNSKYRGEENHKLMNIWQSTDGGATFFLLANSATQHKWPDAVTMAFFPNDPNRIIMPTHGNGVWIGTYNGPPRKVALPADSAQNDSRLPRRFALHHNYPNPFNPLTTIRFDLPQQTHVTLTIYDVLGRRVRTIVDQPMKAGYYVRIWDGRDDQGVAVTSSVYFYRLHAREFDKVRKMAIVR